ncbi:hypothetical protein BLNAU_7069 [Blattamonas nauphoetae]|uniref:Right handed beta helix domain-containing protein n=1 Tax=Blattamonas nauphoetae TaxID=2049346 RepID=A0ABQ9Y2I2_9EUKA|nr:hypothetical protein BLNAU_7069 [Blattamonas nauphoetae]
MLGQFQFTSLQRPVHPSHDWMISESSISDCRGATSGIVFADQNWANSFTCLNSTFLDSPSMLTTRNDASSSTVSYLLAVIINTRKVMQDPACITILGPSLHVSQSNISSTTTSHNKHADNRGISFDSPNGLLIVAYTLIHNFSCRTSGAGLLVGKSEQINLHHSYLYRLYCGGNGASVAIVGKMQQMICHNNVFDKCLATGSSRVNAGGIFLQTESAYSFSLESTTMTRQSSNGIGGGVAFVGIRPFTTIEIHHSWFVKNIGQKSRKMEANGGSLVFGELNDPTGIKVAIETCRFNASSTGGRGRDIFCEKGWETIVTKEALSCSVARSSKWSIYVEGVTGPSDDFWMGLDTPPGCTFIPYRPQYLITPTDRFPVIFWPIFGAYLFFGLFYVYLICGRQLWRVRCPRVFRVLMIIFAWPCLLCLKVAQLRTNFKSGRYARNGIRTDEEASDVLFRGQCTSIYDLNGLVKKFAKFHQKQMKRKSKPLVVKKVPVRRMETVERTPLLKEDESKASRRKTERLNDGEDSSVLNALHQMDCHRRILAILCASPNEPTREMSLKLMTELE